MDMASPHRGMSRGVLTTVICREKLAVMELLGVPTRWAVAGLMALGRPVKEITRLARHPVEELAFVDHFEGPSFTTGQVRAIG